MTRWSEASQDIRALRKIVRDGPLTVNPEARLLFAASLMVAVVKSVTTLAVRAWSNEIATTGRVTT